MSTASQNVLICTSCCQIWTRHWLLCRHQRTIQLDNGSSLTYDVLALAPGLTNETLATVQASGVAGACSVAELAANFSAADAAAMENIVIYGDTVGAIEAKAILEERGVDLEASVLHIAPPGDGDSGAAVLRDVRFRCCCVLCACTVAA